MKTALVVAAHPDDEVLGCGGTMAKMAAQGWAVHILILAEGATARDETRDVSGRSTELSALARCARDAAAAVGAASVSLANFPDNRMDSVDLLDVVKRIEQEITRHSPIRVLTHGAHDVNVDHGVVHDAVIAAARSKPGGCVRELLFFEVLSSTEWRPPSSRAPFAPTYFSDISDHLPAKLAALRAYGPELLDFPHPRSLRAVEHLAGFRGCTAGVAAAEAFEVGRIVD
jgi:LmbE family N-acetylglucosaminyl deacetylase